jgi:hypothetical protein
MPDLKEIHWPRSERERLDLELRMERREHRNTNRMLTVYRYLAIIGWLMAIGTALMPQAKADTLPANSIACVDQDAWLAQMNAKPLELAAGCVFTYRDYSVDVERELVFGGSEVRIGEMLIWVDTGALRK